MVPEQITREIDIDAPVERVWATLTDPGHFQEMFGFASTTIDLRPGGEIVMHWEGHGTYRGVVDRLEPPRVFSFRGAINPDEEPRIGNSTLTEFRLTPTPTGTQVRVVEHGFRQLDLTAAEQTHRAEDNAAGWEIVLPRLAELARRIGT